MTNDETRKLRLSGRDSSCGFRHLNFRRGFTLVELILVLALLVVITSIAVPSLSNFVRGRALDSEARRLAEEAETRFGIQGSVRFAANEHGLVRAILTHDNGG